MTELSREIRLENGLQFEEGYLPIAIRKFLYQRNKVMLGAVLRSIVAHANTKAIYAYFVEHDIAKCKQYFYIATRLTLASVGLAGGACFELGSDFLYALLSDNREVIDALAAVETPELLKERGNPLSGRSQIYMIQLAIMGKDEILREMITKMAKNGRKCDRIDAAAGKDFFSLLLNQDKRGLEELILSKHANIKSFDPRDEDFMSFLGTLEAKLCWFRGIPVEIDHPLIPMELMPVRPLEHYDDVYDFLKPGWVPPRQGVIADFGRWLAKSFGHGSDGGA
jgi:hypothetical protein